MYRDMPHNKAYREKEGNPSQAAVSWNLSESFSGSEPSVLKNGARGIKK